MSTLTDRRTVGEVVTRLYTAAGRKATELELRLYAEVLGRVDAELATEASMRMVATEDWQRRPPSPALLLSYVRDVRDEWRRRQAAIPSATGTPAPPEVQRACLAAVRAEHPRGGDPQPVAASLQRVRAGAHDLDDHQFCEPDCMGDPDVPAPTQEGQ